MGPMRRLLAAMVAVTLGWALLGPAPAIADAPTIVHTELRVPVGAEPDGPAVALDVSLDGPGPGRHPALLLAHGFGGSKADLAEQAREYASAGYLVLSYSARGFGASGGRIHLDDPAYEVADARALIDLLAGRDDVLLDAPGDPRVGVMGASYGGALALLAAGTDPRVDAVVAAVTWNDLASALAPQAGRATAPQAGTGTGAGIPAGPLKQVWLSSFLLGSVGQAPTGGDPALGTGSGNPLCGRFDAHLCTTFLAAADTGKAGDELLRLLRERSPARVAAGIGAPTLLIQGMADSLFGLEQADATARALAAAGTPHAVRWIDGGHDGPSSTADADAAAARSWLDHYLRDGGSRSGPTPEPGFVYAAPRARRATTTSLWASDDYPGLLGPGTGTELPLAPSPGATGRVLSPPGGAPAATTTVPGAGGVAGAAGGMPLWPLATLPGQWTAFDTAPVPTRLTVAGSPTVRLRVTSTTTDATLFVSLWLVSGDLAVLPRRLVAPLTVRTTPGVPVDVDVALPAATWTMEAGSRWRVLVTGTDAGYAMPRDARAYSVSLATPTMTVPLAPAAVALLNREPDRESQLVGLALAALLVALAASAVWRGRRRRAAVISPRTRNDSPAVEVSGLSKTFPDGHRAVDDVSWAAWPGQVVGLLGANGAGKTTTMRMMVGLIAPDAGQVRILDEQVLPGAPVLGRIGTLIEGPGLLPHRSGRDNLLAWWSATGRSATGMDLDAALNVAALGDALKRPVRSYSHGMRQRLGIAQALLGRPTVLLLDEPTNGLDPPQIAAMRGVLRDYAAAGGTVIVSSHLLAEVEVTCSHVVVMDRGRVLLTGEVAGLRGDGRLEDVVLHAIAQGRRLSDDRAEELREVRPR